MNKEQTQPLKEIAPAIEDEKLVSSVEERLNNTFDNVSAEDLKEEGLSTSDENQTDDSKPEDDSTPDEDQKNTDESGDKDADENKDAPSESDEKNKELELPDAYHRAAIHDGWKPEGIKEFFEANPERALNTFQNVYNSVNRASRDFAALGRKQAEDTRQQVTETDEKVEIKDFVDIAKLKEDDENNPLIDSVIKPMNDALKQVTQEVKSLKSRNNPSVAEIEFAKNDQIAATARVEATADESDAKLVEQFFTAESMKPYNEFYGMLKMGQIPQDLTPGQQKHRYEVCQVAGQLITGTSMQGLDLSVSDALTRAHLLVTEPIRDSVIRDEIKSSLEKRNKGRTLRPSASKKSAAAVEISGRPKDRKELIRRTEQRLAGTFNNE